MHNIETKLKENICWDHVQEFCRYVAIDRKRTHQILDSSMIIVQTHTNRSGWQRDCQQEHREVGIREDGGK